MIETRISKIKLTQHQKNFPFTNKKNGLVSQSQDTLTSSKQNLIVA